MLESTTLQNAGEMRTAQKAARAVVVKLLGNLKHGSLTVIENYSSKQPLITESYGDSAGIHATIEIRHPDFFRNMLRGGSIAVGEAYMDNWWESPNLTALMQLMALNLPLLDGLEAKTGKLVSLANRFSHWLNKNTIKKSKSNIEAHYDIGNDLYRQFLDGSMLYSSGIYTQSSDTLEQAQINKMERLCQQLELKPSDDVIEIGTGWGAMAIYMAEHYGCKVTTTTISEQQYVYAKNEIDKKGLRGQVTLLKKDYRDLTGRFDKLVSIEMVEAVGKTFLPSYIRKCNELIKPGGLMAIQSITIADQRYDDYAGRVDFIQKYIFPGGFLPSVTALLKTTTKESELVLINAVDIGKDYALTLSDWHNRFIAALDEVRALGYDDRFIRMWRYYFSYCEGGFLAKSIGTVQLTFRKSGAA